MQPAICRQYAQPIDARPPVDVSQSIADAAGSCGDDCFFYTF